MGRDLLLIDRLASSLVKPILAMADPRHFLGNRAVTLPTPIIDKLIELIDRLGSRAPGVGQVEDSILAKSFPLFNLCGLAPNRQELKVTDDKRRIDGAARRSCSYATYS